MRDLIPSSSSSQSGFTLLEIIVVVVLIAISVTVLVVNLERDTDAVAELEARRFARLIEQARDESILSGRPYAVSMDENGRYEFLQHDEDWVPVEGDDMFRPRRIPPDLSVSFEMLDGPDEEDASGMLIVEGLGEITPFELRIGGDSRVYTVSVDQGQALVVDNAPR